MLQALSMSQPSDNAAQNGSDGSGAAPADDDVIDADFTVS
jgi:hypothetical protein